MITVNNLTPDSACRTFFNNDIYFSAFCNAVLFNGKQLISAQNLIHYENDSAVIINDTKKVEDKKGEKIIPQVMIVFYTGDRKWNAPLRLSDYFEIPENSMKRKE